MIKINFTVCKKSSFLQNLVVYFNGSTTTAAQEEIYTSSNTMPDLPFSCTFGTNSQSDLCGFSQDTTDDWDWDANVNGTRTPHTGPPDLSWAQYGICVMYNNYNVGI